MVYRKLAQHVTAFRAFLRAQAKNVYGADTPENVERFAAKVVGRWRSGCPLSLSPEKDDRQIAHDAKLNNDFRFADDPDGARCPIGSHIRRMNPRDAVISGEVPTRRIVRRGLPYGPWLEEGAPDDKAERGVAFMAINANIKDQFEFLQREWANNGEFAKLDRDEVDPLAGERRPGAVFCVKDPSGTPRWINLPAFVTLRGGGYFFIPSLTGLRAIAAGTA